MKIMHQDLKQGEVTMLIEHAEDLWYLNQVTEPGDLCKAKTVRKLKLGGDDKKAKIVKKTVFLTINVTQTNYQEQVLRISGTIEEGPEDIPRGSHHTISAEIGSTITIIKKQWMKFHLNKLEQSMQQTSTVLIVAVERDEATFALLKKQGYEIILHLNGEVERKRMEQTITKDFLSIVVDQIAQYVTRYSIEQIILGSPSFWREKVSSKLPSELQKKTILATCSGGGKRNIRELLLRDELKQALQKERSRQELTIVDELLTRIGKQDKAAYGVAETTAAVQAGAVEHLLITDHCLAKAKEEGTFAEFDALLKKTEQLQASIIILNSQMESGKTVDGLGGIAALLRFAL